MKWNRLLLIQLLLLPYLCFTQVDIRWSKILENDLDIFSLTETDDGIQVMGINYFQSALVFWQVDPSGEFSQENLVAHSDTVKYLSIDQIVYWEDYKVVSGSITYYGAGRIAISVISSDYEIIWEKILPDSLGGITSQSLSISEDTLFALTATSGAPYIDPIFSIHSWNIDGVELPIIQIPRSSGGQNFSLTESNGLHFIHDKTEALYVYVVNRNGVVIQESISEWPVEVATTFYGGMATTEPIQFNGSIYDATPKSSDDGLYSFVYNQVYTLGFDPVIQPISGPSNAYGVNLSLIKSTIANRFLSSEYLSKIDGSKLFILTELDSNLLILNTRSFTLTDIPNLPSLGSHGVSQDWKHHYHFYPYDGSSTSQAYFVTVDELNNYNIDTLKDGFTTNPESGTMLVTSDAIYLHVKKTDALGVSIQQLLCLGAPGLSIETSLNSTNCFVYPNPFRTELTISNLKPGRYQCRLLYLSGQDVWSSTQTLSGDQLKLQFPALPNGYYILELSEKDVVYRKSIIRF